MSGGPVIIIDPEGQVRSALSMEETIDKLRKAADQLDYGRADIEVMNPPSGDAE